MRSARVTARSDPPAPSIVNHQRAYQGNDSLGQRSWAVAVQLYGIRSRRNWGHGDFTDLANLIDIAAAQGAAAIGLNPLHALFDDRPEEASPYFPNSRHFLNPLYVDVEAVPEFPQAARAKFQSDIEALREKDLVDYADCRKHQGRGAGAGLRQLLFARQRRAPAAVRCVPARARTAACGFAAFELLRRRFKHPWWEWPDEWRKPDRERTCPFANRVRRRACLCRVHAMDRRSAARCLPRPRA